MRHYKSYKPLLKVIKMQYLMLYLIGNKRFYTLVEQIVLLEFGNDFLFVDIKVIKYL